MAELYQILGSIFRNIAQARVTSDMYSRDISKYYEQDPLLRKFPTPRTEVDEVEVDLKFVLSGIEQTEIQDGTHETSVATIFVKTSSDITQSFFDNILEASGSEYVLPEETKKILKGFEHRIYLKQKLLLYFQRQCSSLLKGNKFDTDEALKDITAQLDDKFSELFKDSGLEKETLKSLKEDAYRKTDLESILESIRHPLQEAYASAGNSKVAVDVTVDKLADTPESAICSIKVKARVRNYTWTEVEHEGETWRALNPE